MKSFFVIFTFFVVTSAMASSSCTIDDKSAGLDVAAGSNDLYYNVDIYKLFKKKGYEFRNKSDSNASSIITFKLSYNQDSDYVTKAEVKLVSASGKVIVADSTKFALINPYAALPNAVKSAIKSLPDCDELNFDQE